VDQRGCFGCILRKYTDADSAGSMQFIIQNGKWLAEGSANQLGGRLRCFGRLTTIQQKREFVSAQPGNRIFRLNNIHKPSSSLAQKYVPRSMAISIVDVSESIQIERQHSEGVFLALAPKAVLIVFAVFVAIVAVTRYISLGSMVASALFPFCFYLLQPAHATPGVLIMLSGISLLIIYRHRENISRLLAGTENRFGAK